MPPFSLGGEDWAVSPDGQEACFSRKDRKDEAWSTNADVFVVPTAGGAPKRVGDAPGYDGGCRYSPDGSLLAWRAQERAGYESDRWRLVVLDRKTGAKRTSHRRPSTGTVESFVFSPDSRTIYFTAEEAGRSPSSPCPRRAARSRPCSPAARSATSRSCPTGRRSSRTQVALTHPAEIVRFGADGKGLARVTRVNDAFLAGFALRPGRERHLRGRRREERPGLDREAACASTPRGSTRCSSSSTAGRRGRGRTAGPTAGTRRSSRAPATWSSCRTRAARSGWGQELTDDVNRDWGGKAFEDVMKGTDFAEALPYVEKGRTRGRGRQLRRLHDRLDRGADRPLQGPGHPRRRLRPRLDVRLDRGAVVPGVGVRRARTGRTPRATRASTPATS